MLICPRKHFFVQLFLIYIFKKVSHTQIHKYTLFLHNLTSSLRLNEVRLIHFLSYLTFYGSCLSFLLYSEVYLDFTSLCSSFTLLNRFQLAIVKTFYSFPKPRYKRRESQVILSNKLENERKRSE